MRGTGLQAEKTHRVIFFGGGGDIAAAYREACPQGWELMLHDEIAPDDLPQRLSWADAIIHRDRPITTDHLKHLKRVRIVQRHGVGLDSLDVGILKSAGIHVCVNPEGTEPVAEHTILLMLAALSGLIEMSADVKSGNWRQDGSALSRRSLVGATVGLAGYGRIGRAVARRLPAFGCRINVLSKSMPLGLSDTSTGPMVTNVASLDELFSESNVLSLHLPLTDATLRIVNRRVLSLLPEGAVLVNTARGGLLDTEDVLDSLERGSLAALAVDVMNHPDRLPDSKLIQHPRVIATPHIAAATSETTSRKVRFTYANLQRAVLGQPLLERRA